MRVSRGRDGRWTRSSDNETEIPEIRKNRKDTDKIRKVFLVIYACCWLVSTLRLLTKISLWLFCFIILKKMTNIDAITLFKKTVTTCVEDGDTCVSKVKEAFLPASNIAADYWVTFRVAASGEPDADHVIQLAFPLLFKNPLALLLAAIFTGLIHFSLGYMHKFLTNIANIADKAAPQQGLLRKYGGGALAH